jgi:predicted nuclease with TOPRIM domain
MQDKARTMLGKIFPILSLVLLLLGGTLLFVACNGEKAELQKQAAQDQEKIKTLERQASESAAQISKLEERTKDLTGRIPEAHAVVSGDSHWKIAHDFLTEKKNVPSEKAGAILAETALSDKILVGYRVWNYFSDGIYGTFLTRGEAAVSPGELQRMEKQRQEKEKQKLMDEISNWEKLTAELKKTNAAELDKWKANNEALQDQLKSASADLALAKNQNKDLETRLNSVYYLAGAKDQLKASGKIKGTFLGLCGDRLKNVTSSDFQKSLDLRNSDTIELSAAELGLSRIRKVALFPAYMEEGKDFRVEIAPDGKTIKVRMLDKDKFRLARIVLVLN